MKSKLIGYAICFLSLIIILSACGSTGSGGNGGNETSEVNYTVGGTVNGLSGSGLVLQNNGTDDLTVSTNGTFTFATKIANGAVYAVTVKTQPSNPTQTCTVLNGSGTVSDADVTGIAITCSDSSSTEITFPEPVATEVGSPVGSEASKTIGVSGGELSSPDSSLTVSIPADALATDTEISIQPITNTAHGGIGNGYHLTPDDTTFQQPASLTFAYTDQDMSGTVPEALGIAFQTADGYWQLADNVTIDTEAKTITTTTTHFSRWSFVEQFRLNPSEATVKVNDALLLQVEFCYELRGARDPKTYERPVLGFKCGPFDVSIASILLSDWSVNGIPGGNSKWGTLDGRVDRGGYTAPSTKPDPNIVAVSVKVLNIPNKNSKVLLTSNITIIDVASYYGVVKFSGTRHEYGWKVEYSGSAHLDFILAQDDGDVQRYDLNKSEVWTDVTFNKWDETEEERVCHLVDKASTLFTGHGYPVGWLFTYIHPNINSYGFLADIEAVGTQQCTMGKGEDAYVVTEPAYPFVTLTTKENDENSWFKPLGDGKHLTGTSTFIMTTEPYELIDIEWDLTKF